MPQRSRQAVARLDRLDLAELEELQRDCRLCRLADARTQVVVGQGDPQADIVFVADAPGWHEDAAGIGLQGVGGELFDALLARLGRTRDNIFLTHAVRCRPPANRTPFPDEIQACEGYLFREVSLIKPRLVVTFGNIPLRLVTGRQLQLSHVHGEPLDCIIQGRSTAVLPLFHPAAAARIPALREQLLHDADCIPRLLRSDDVVSVDAGPASLAVERQSAAAAPEPASVTPPPDDPGSQLTFDMGGE